MSECIMQCGTELSGRQQLFCSDKCRKKYKRNADKVSDLPGQAELMAGVPSGLQTATEAECLGRIDQPDLSLLPDSVTHPTGRRTEETNEIPIPQLARRVSHYRDTDWIGSPEYAEVIYCLLNSTVEQLKAEHQFIPAWRLRQSA